MSIFIVTETIGVPGEPGTVTIRKLTPKQLKKAAKARARELMADWREQVDQTREMAPLIKEIRDIFADGTQLEKAKADTDKATKADPLIMYDPLTVIQEGLVEWTYEVPLEHERVGEVLDADALEYLARAILRFSKPSLFAEFDAERDQKNASPSSSVH